MKTEKELIEEANGLIRSFNSIVKRRGVNTNWDAIDRKIKRILLEQHFYMYPHQYLTSLVVCNNCTHIWLATRPKDLTKMECPGCLDMSGFENIESGCGDYLPEPPKD